MNTVSTLLRTLIVTGTLLGISSLLGASSASADALHPSRVGFYEGAGCDGVNGNTAFTAWSGHVPARALDFLPGANQWSDMGNIAWWMKCWKGQPQDVIWSLPMLPNDGVSTLAQGAAGAYDNYFTKLAKDLVAGGQGKTVIRLGWEFNGGWYPWAASKDPASFIAYWHRIVTAMRAVPGAQFEFDWCSSWGYQQGKTSDYYPGDAYVDIVGMDVYNKWWNTADKDPQTRWTDFVGQTWTYGLAWQKWFAQQHHKMISFPEWGTGTEPDGHGAGDDPLFITNMLNWMKTPVAAGQPDVAYSDYWDYHASDYYAKLSDNHQPQSGLAYLQFWNWNSADVAAAKAIADKTS